MSVHMVSTARAVVRRHPGHQERLHPTLLGSVLLVALMAACLLAASRSAWPMTLVILAGVARQVAVMAGIGQRRA